MGDEYDLSFPPWPGAHGERVENHKSATPFPRQLMDTQHCRRLGIVDPEEFEQLPPTAFALQGTL